MVLKGLPNIVEFHNLGGSLRLSGQFMEALLRWLGAYP